MPGGELGRYERRDDSERIETAAERLMRDSRDGPAFRDVVHRPIDGQSDWLAIRYKGEDSEAGEADDSPAHEGSETPRSEAVNATSPADDLGEGSEVDDAHPMEPTEDQKRHFLGELPERTSPGDRTRGILVDAEGNSFDLVSGGWERVEGERRRDELALSAREKVLGLGEPRDLAVTRDVEMKVAAWMVDTDTKNVLLFINNRVCEGEDSCSTWVPKILSEGSTLAVVENDGNVLFLEGTRHVD